MKGSLQSSTRPYYSEAQAFVGHRAALHLRRKKHSVHKPSRTRGLWMDESCKYEGPAHQLGLIYSRKLLIWGNSDDVWWVGVRNDVLRARGAGNHLALNSSRVSGVGESFVSGNFREQNPANTDNSPIKQIGMARLPTDCRKAERNSRNCSIELTSFSRHNLNSPAQMVKQLHQAWKPLTLAQDQCFCIN